MNSKENAKIILAETLKIVNASSFPASEAKRVIATQELLATMLEVLDRELAQESKENENAPKEEINN